MSWLILLALLKKLDKKIDDLETVTFRKVDELPATGEANVIYFVPKTDAEEGNYSDEYIWDSASETYEQIGDSAIDPLPEVTTADNGKVLGVANGVWDKISFNKGVEIFKVRLNGDGTGVTLQNSKKIKDLRDSASNGFLPILLPDNSESANRVWYGYPAWIGKSANSEVVFTKAQIDKNYILNNSYVFSATRYIATTDSGNTLSIISIEIPIIPLPYSNYRGKILTVGSNGQYTLANIPTELPAVTSSDEGKVLTVDSNGEWVASALPDGTNQQY